MSVQDQNATPIPPSMIWSIAIYSFGITPTDYVNGMSQMFKK